MIPEALHHIVAEINSASNIEQSDMIHQDCNVVIFNKNNKERMNILAEIPKLPQQIKKEMDESSKYHIKYLFQRKILKNFRNE
uniref:Uncharacterized protein n=1 Tax=uncultured bacterium contig00026 TaxID=1181515 RepID=A0A806JY02_9BACT|nr:hypothetical protein [uncultured bacterium contig00026]